MKWSIMASLMPTILFGMYKQPYSYYHVLADSAYIKQLFKNSRGTRVHTPEVLLKNVITQAASSKYCEKQYVRNIQSSVRTTDFKQDWRNVDAQSFLQMLSFVPWDGKNNDDTPFHGIVLNDQKLIVTVREYYSKSMTPVNIIEFIGDTDNLNYPDHYQKVMTAYEELMRE